MKVHTQKELEEIKNKKNSNDAMEEFLTDKRKEWNDRIEEVFVTLKSRNMNSTDYKKTVDAQALVLSYIQEINERTSFYLNKLSKNTVELKRAKQNKFLFYSTGFGMKTTMGEKKILIDGTLGELERGSVLLETHIDFLRESANNLRTFNYSFKNIIALLDYLG